MQKVTRRLGIGSLAALLSVMLLASAAMAAVVFDSVTGTGFVGKGDVQLALNLNNKQLQAAAETLQFRASSTTVSEVSWECTNLRNENTQERERTTTTTTEGVVSSVARERNQVTGFNLTGYSADGSSSSSETEGPHLNSCPNNWALTTPAGEPVIDEEASGSTLEVSSDGQNWVAL